MRVTYAYSYMYTQHVAKGPVCVNKHFNCTIYIFGCKCAIVSLPCVQKLTYTHLLYEYIWRNFHAQSSRVTKVTLCTNDDNTEPGGTAQKHTKCMKRNRNIEI